MDFFGQLSLDVGRLRGAAAPGTPEQTSFGDFSAALEEVTSAGEVGDSPLATGAETALAPPVTAAPVDDAPQMLSEPGGKLLPEGAVDGGSKLPLLYAEQIDAESLDDEAPVRSLAAASTTALATAEVPAPETRSLAGVGFTEAGAPASAAETPLAGVALRRGGDPRAALEVSPGERDGSGDAMLVAERDRAAQLGASEASADPQAATALAPEPLVDTAGVAASATAAAAPKGGVRSAPESGSREPARVEATALESGSALRRTPLDDLRATTRAAMDDALDTPVVPETPRALDVPAPRAADTQPAALAAATSGASASVVAAPGAPVTAAAPQGAVTTGSAPPATLPPMDSPGFERSLGARVDALLEADGGKVSLRLTPAHLGTVELSVVMSEEGAQISIVASQAAARELLESAVPKLRDQFAAAGHSLDSVQLEARDPASREDARESGRGLADGGDRSAGGAAGAADASLDARPGASSLSLRTPSLLDAYA